MSGETYAILKTIELHADVDDAVFNPVNKNYYVENGPRSTETHYLSVIDTATFQHLGDIALPGIMSASPRTISRKPKFSFPQAIPLDLNG